MNDVVKEEIKALYKEGNEILSGFKDNTDKHVNLRRKYQIWYTKSLIVVKEVLPDRYNEFVECYTCSKRKEISYSNFSMYDFLIGISVSRGGVSLFDPKIAGLVRFATQISFKINLKKFREISINFFSWYVIIKRQCKILDGKNKKKDFNVFKIRKNINNFP